MQKKRGIDYDTYEALDLARLDGYKNGDHEPPVWLRRNVPMNPICMKCGTEMKCKQNDVLIQSENDKGPRYSTDLYECMEKGCDTLIAKGHSEMLFGDYRKDEVPVIQFRHNPKNLK